MKQALYYDFKEHDLYIKALGHITANACPELKRITFAEFSKTNKQINHIYLNLSECEYMDSTFLGLIVGFNKLLMQKSKKKLTVVNPTEQCFELLKGLGIITLIEISDSCPDFPTDMNLLSDQRKASTDLLLKAHEELMSLSSKNRDKFKLLHSLLQQQNKNEK